MSDVRATKGTTMRAMTIMIPLTLALTTTPLFAQRAGQWETVGQRKVGFGVDYDEIKLRGNARHRQVRLCADRRDFALLDADVFYANGGEQDISDKVSIRRGTCSRAFDLRGNRRDITKIKLSYSRFNTGRGPVVRVQAR
jgi:hypothetical protein